MRSEMVNHCAIMPQRLTVSKLPAPPETVSHYAISPQCLTVSRCDAKCVKTFKAAKTYSGGGFESSLG
jgi:hypothetical protein